MPCAWEEPWEGPILLTAEGTGVCKPSVAYANNESNAFTVKMGSLFSLSAPLVATPRPGRGTHQITHIHALALALYWSIAHLACAIRHPLTRAGRGLSPRLPVSPLQKRRLKGGSACSGRCLRPPATCGRGPQRIHATCSVDCGLDGFVGCVSVDFKLQGLPDLTAGLCCAALALGLV